MKTFETPVLELKKFEMADVITASGEFGEEEDGGGWA